MSLHITPNVLVGAYEFVRTTRPFRGWKLPHSDEVRFIVIRSPKMMGYHNGDLRNFTDHEIGISDACIGTSRLLIEIMGHEMIHQYQRRNRLETHNVEHNEDFRRRAKVVCREHGFDYKAFI